MCCLKNALVVAHMHSLDAREHCTINGDVYLFMTKFLFVNPVCTFAEDNTHFAMPLPEIKRTAKN
jgi:hypothetical protein